MNIRRLIFGLFVFLVWALYVLYPNPTYLTRSVYRLYDPPISPHIKEIQYIATATAERTPSQTERFIKAAFPYQYDWETYNLPWYFPSVKEAVKKQAGDCKTRFIVIASVLTAQKIPHTLSVSPTHVWVEYEEKKETSNENQEVTMFNSEKGLSVPRVDLQKSSRSFINAFWHPMPIEKKQSLLSGLLFFPLLALVPEKRFSLF